MSLSAAPSVEGREAQVPLQITAQEQAVDDLRLTVEELEKRLRPVMRASPEASPKDGSGPTPVLVDMAAAIAENTARVKIIRQGVVQILDRLEI